MPGELLVAVPLEPVLAVFPCLEPVGEDPLLAVVGDPEGDAVEEEAAWVVVGVVQGVLREPARRSRGRRRRGSPCHRRAPHIVRVVGPDAARIAIAVGECDVALGEALAGLEVVGEQLLLAAVGDPEDRAIGPHAARRAVGLVELELAVLHALAGREVVGVDGVVGAGAVLEDPERRAVGPRTRGLVVTAAEVLDVARHAPLEVDHARAGATPAASATAATATSASAASAATAGGRRHHDDGTGDDHDGDVDGRCGIGLAAAVVSRDRDHVSVLRGDNEGRSRGDGDLATAAVDLERRRVGAGVAVRERVVVDVGSRDGRANVVAALGAFGHAARARV